MSNFIDKYQQKAFLPPRKFQNDELYFYGLNHEDRRGYEIYETYEDAFSAWTDHMDFCTWNPTVKFQVYDRLDHGGHGEGIVWQVEWDLKKDRDALLKYHKEYVNNSVTCLPLC